MSHALRETNLRIPEDMSEVGFDDIPTSILDDSFFTAAVQPTYEMGGQTVELLVTRLEKEGLDAFRDSIVPVEIVVLKCTAVPPNI